MDYSVCINACLMYGICLASGNLIKNGDIDYCCLGSYFSTAEHSHNLWVAIMNFVPNLGLQINLTLTNNKIV